MANWNVNINFPDLSQEQKDEVLAFLHGKNWTVNVTEEKKSTESSETTDESQDNEEEDVFPMPRHRHGEEECPDCFCGPCMVDESNRQLWWPDESEPAKCVNASRRKDLYRRFWAMMENCGAWRDPRYLQKKQAMKGRRSSTRFYREVMPECVLRQCRSWLPNPDKVPYMGHKWS